MKGAFLYVNAGKGHYIPAEALANSFKEAGDEAVLDDLFVAMGTPFWEWFCKYDWRLLLHFPRLEGIVHKASDNRLSYALIRWQGLLKCHVRSFEKWYNTYKPDFIVSTNFIGGIFLPVVTERLGIKIPIFQYAADIFDTPLSGINNSITKMYLPSEVGCKNAIKKGQSPESVSLCPFPLRQNVQRAEILTKEEAREKLGLKNKPTILMSLGGEGIGSVEFPEMMVKHGYDWQIVVIGGVSKTTSASFERFHEKYPNVDLYHPGFVNNVSDYILASDMQIGKAGANALMESLYLKRPVLITNLLYAAWATRDFFKEHPVGWAENNPKKQIEIAANYLHNPELQDKIRDQFENMPIEFGADKFRSLIIKDTEAFYSNA